MKTLINIIFSYPTLGGLILGILLILAIKYRKNILEHIKSKYPSFFKKIKFSNDIIIYCENIGEIFEFKKSLVISEYSLFFNSMNKKIKKLQKANKTLILDLSNINEINNEAEEAIRDTIRNLIIENKIKSKIIFPYKVLDILFFDIKKLLKDKSCKIVEIKKIKKRS